MPDIRTDQDVLDFSIKMKLSLDKNPDKSLQYCYYFPNLNEDESAIMSLGHHVMHDGISLF